MTPVTQLVLAGGGHSHALLLRRWAMRPKQRPKGLITLVNRSSTTLYSGMVPGLIAGLYTCDQVAIDLRRLADEAGVIFVQGEIQGLDLTSQTLRLEGRLPLPFTQLSLDVGAISRPVAFDKSMSAADWIPIKPLEPALAFLESQDGNSSTPFMWWALVWQGGSRPGPQAPLANALHPPPGARQSSSSTPRQSPSGCRRAHRAPTRKCSSRHSPGNVLTRPDLQRQPRS